MKCCVIYTGLYSTANICLPSHKEYIYDVLEKNNIDYDVNIFVSPTIKIVDNSCEKLMEFVTNHKKKLIEIFDDKNISIEDKDIKKVNFFTYQIERPMEVEDMKSKFYNIIKKEKIKEFFFTKVISDKYMSEDIHTSNGFFKTNFYKRAKIMEEKIDDKNYDFIIHLRPDFLIKKSIDEIIQKVKKLNEDFIFLNWRHDIFYISNKIFCKKLSKESFDKILENENETDITSLKYIIKNGKYPRGLHMEVYSKELYEKLNIKLESIGIGHKWANASDIF